MPVARSLGVVGAVTYPRRLDSSSGDVRTYSALAEYFESITVIAQTGRLVPHRQRVGKVLYILLPRLPRPIDIFAFPLAAMLIAFTLYLRGIRTWSFSDPLRSGLVCLAMRWLPRARLVVQVQGQLLHMPSDRFGKATSLVEALSRYVIRRADMVRVVSRDIARTVIAAGVEPGRVALVRSRCDTELFDPDRSKTAGSVMRGSLPGNPTHPIVGFAGTLNASKGLDVLVTAVGLLAKRRPVRVAVAGDGPLRKEVEEALVSGSPIILLGHLPAADVPRFLAAIDVLAVPSYDEGLPRVVLEAMAMQVPVVASNVGGIPEAIEQDVTGILVPVGDAQALASALGRVIDDDALASRLGEAARRRVLDEFEAQAGLRQFAAIHGATDAVRPVAA
jgi:glycosyltransferase involved in cell wall biosynthesis